MTVGMNLNNALGLATLGLVMKTLPLWLPSVANGDPAGTRVLWLGVMSFVMFAIAGAWMFSRLWQYRDRLFGATEPAYVREERQRERAVGAYALVNGGDRGMIRVER